MRGEKREKKINVKDQCFLHSCINNDNTNIYMFIQKSVKWKNKCLHLFNKKTPLYTGLGLKQKTFSNFQASYQKELCLLFENQAIFFTEPTYR